MKQFEAPELTLTSVTLTSTISTSGGDNELPMIPLINENMLDLTKIE